MDHVRYAHDLIFKFQQQLSRDVRKGGEYNGIERALSTQIKFNLGARLLILGSFLQTISKLVGVRGGVSWDRKNLEYERDKKQCTPTRRLQVQK